MLNRFALVIHWLSLLIAVSFAVGVGIDSVSTSELVEISEKGEALLNEARSNGDVTAAIPQMSDRDLNTLVANADGVERTVIDWSQAPFLLAVLIIPLLLGWAIRFILTGSKVIFPWSKPKDINP